MLVKGSQNRHSGAGTTMFSRSGASTIAAYKVFKSKVTDIDEVIAEGRVKKTAKR